MTVTARNAHTIVAGAFGLVSGAIIIGSLPAFRLARECAGWGGWTEIAAGFLALGVVAGFSWIARLVGLLARDRCAGFVAISLTVAAAFVLVALLVLPDHIDSRKNRLAIDTFIQMRDMRNQLEQYVQDNKQLPETTSIVGLEKATNGALKLPRRDAWGNPYQLRTRANGFDLISFGQCGHADPSGSDDCLQTAHEDYRADLVILNNEWCSWHLLPEQHPEHP